MNIVLPPLPEHTYRPVQQGNDSAGDTADDDACSSSSPIPPDVLYIAVEVIVAALAVTGNLLTIVVFCLNHRLRTPINYYVISLAVADFLVGLMGIPFAILSSMGLPRQFDGCLFVNSLLLVLCTISILSLVAVSLDKFWAILMPYTYRRQMNRRTAITVIIICWLIGSIIGFLPLMGWNNRAQTLSIPSTSPSIPSTMPSIPSTTPTIPSTTPSIPSTMPSIPHTTPASESAKAGMESTPDGRCIFMEVMDLAYLVYVIFFGTIITPTLLLGAFYTKIYLEIRRQLVQTAIPLSVVSRHTSPAYEKRREVHAVKSLALLVACFVICWFPLYTMNTAMYFCPPPFLRSMGDDEAVAPTCTATVPAELIKMAIVLSHANSAINPVLYAFAYHDFRRAFIKLLNVGCQKLATITTYFQEDEVSRRQKESQKWKREISEALLHRNSSLELERMRHWRDGYNGQKGHYSDVMCNVKLNSNDIIYQPIEQSDEHHMVRDGEVGVREGEVGVREGEEVRRQGGEVVRDGGEVEKEDEVGREGVVRQSGEKRKCEFVGELCIKMTDEVVRDLISDVCDINVISHNKRMWEEISERQNIRQVMRMGIRGRYDEVTELMSMPNQIREDDDSRGRRGTA